mmetsp:Transcript_31113/g.40023  ORF Transcript_31113/g.40023 Transcript_31113/m.40023 type:complete len:405 (-) Transcript_31113:1385-2599(-)
MNESSSNCSSCDKGKYQGSTGQSQCEDCEAGKYSNVLGSASCLSCGAGKTSQSGADDCKFAAALYYVSDKSRQTTSSCPHHAVCNGGLFSPIPKQDYWIDHSSYDYAGDLYRCTRDTCIGGGNHSFCWTLHGFNNTQCYENSALQCSEGSFGPLCGSCEQGYVYSVTSRTCDSCNEETKVFTYLIMTGLFILLLMMVMFSNLDEEHQWKQRFRGLIRYVDSGSLKVLWVTSQIIVSSSLTLNIKFPSPFSNMLGFMSVFSFDFLSLECLYTKGNVYLRTAYVWCIVPIVIASLIILVGIGRIMTHCSLNYHLRDIGGTMTNQQDIINQHTWMLLFLSYVVLPPVSNKQLQIFDCLSLNSGETFLRADTSISCTSQEYLSFRSFIIFFVILYQMIPITWTLLISK